MIGINFKNIRNMHGLPEGKLITLEPGDATRYEMIVMFNSDHDISVYRYNGQQSLIAFPIHEIKKFCTENLEYSRELAQHDYIQKMAKEHTTNPNTVVAMVMAAEIFLSEPY